LYCAGVLRLKSTKTKNSQIYKLKSKHTQNFCSADFRQRVYMLMTVEKKLRLKRGDVFFKCIKTYMRILVPLMDTSRRIMSNKNINS